MVEKTNNNEKKKDVYHLSVTASRYYYSYKKPSENGYCSCHIKLYNGYPTIQFRRFITSDNVLDIHCYLQPSKLFNMVQLLEGIMARRRDDFMAGNDYTEHVSITVPVSTLKDGNEKITGELKFTTEIVEGIPRINMRLYDLDKDDTIEILFCSRVPMGDIEARTSGELRIDACDVDMFDFLITLRELQNPIIPLVYRIQDAAVSQLSKYIAGFFQKRNKNIEGPSEYKPSDIPKGEWNDSSVTF